ncbi:uncharacterized protein EI90DRAFT_3085410 [Cantharellus anzutake]|uniref:uncharacterized protein n=1 Tax=Cantharellus anzutake TaxID=1750568 RepID=UPI0019064ED0|nr:uncharacterized protein EI90DRAFT_3085410 [Cantharellus anzutake]KAF8317246.1 hypothetical protein EI90DRAFT_3085410 [Cantharellus anzutake]
MGGVPFVPPRFYEFDNHNGIELFREGAAMHGVRKWLLHRSMSLFCPPKSSLYKLYGHLSDPVQIFGISGKILNHLIPLSEASLNAQMLMEAKLDGLPNKVNKWGVKEINYEAEFHEPDVRNGIVTCAALSRDGRYIALGFGSGVIEIADIDDQHTISQFQNHPPSPPAWIEFIHGGHHVATEDVNGNITIYSHGMLPVKLGTLPIGAYPVVTAVSDSGLLIIRVLRDPGKPWYNNVACIYILGDPHIQLLASPPSIPSLQSNAEPAFPERHTVAFSPGARYIAAFDGHSAFTWSTELGDFIAHYDIRGDKSWIINTGMAPTCPYHIPHPVSTQPTLLLAGDTVYAHCSWVDAGPELDEVWIKCPFFHHFPKHERGYSFAAGRTPLVYHASPIWLGVWFNGRSQLAVPQEYRMVSVKANSTNGIQPWYGDRLINYINDFYHPQSSKDGTRFLLQGKMKAPIVVDIGQAAWYPSAMLDYDFPVPNDYSPCSTASDTSSPCDISSDDSSSETSDSPQDRLL